MSAVLCNPLNPLDSGDIEYTHCMEVTPASRHAFRYAQLVLSVGHTQPLTDQYSIFNTTTSSSMSSSTEYFCHQPLRYRLPILVDILNLLKVKDPRLPPHGSSNPSLYHCRYTSIIFWAHFWSPYYDTGLA